MKLGVSGCPRNCAEATGKDIAVICVDSGYQISIGGVAGMDMRETELLCHLPTEADVIAGIKAVAQLCRENAKYLNRLYKWMAKVGLEWIGEQILDLENRAALGARPDLSQSVFRKDPRAQHVAKAEPCQPLATLTLEAAE